MKKAVSHPDYPAFLAALKERILHARTFAARAVNRELVLLYWDIGRSIVEKQQIAGWGDAVVERLAADLRAAFPDMRGFSPRNIWDMRRLYAACTDAHFLAQVVPEIGRDTKSPILRQAVAELDAQSQTAVARSQPTKADESETFEQAIQGARHGKTSPHSVAKPSAVDVIGFVRQLVAQIPWGQHLLRAALPPRR